MSDNLIKMNVFGVLKNPYIKVSAVCLSTVTHFQCVFEGLTIFDHSIYNSEGLNEYYKPLQTSYLSTSRGAKA